MRKRTIILSVSAAVIGAVGLAWAVTTLMVDKPPGPAAAPAAPGPAAALTAAGAPPSVGPPGLPGQPMQPQGLVSRASPAGGAGMPPPGPQAGSLGAQGPSGDGAVGQDPMARSDRLPVSAGRSPVLAPTAPSGERKVQGSMMDTLPPMTASPRMPVAIADPAPMAGAPLPGREQAPLPQLDGEAARQVQGLCLVPGRQDCEVEVEALFGTAANRILIQTDTLPSARLTEALLGARARGVEVRLILDAAVMKRKDARPAVKRLVDRGLLVVANDAANRQPNRYAVIDTAYVLSGTYRLDGQQAGWQSLITLRSASVARDFEAFWIGQWSASAAIPVASR